MRMVLPSSDRWQQCARYKPIRRRPHSVDCTTTLNDRCARDACSFDGKLVDDTLFTIRQTTPTVKKFYHKHFYKSVNSPEAERRGSPVVGR